MDISMGCRLTVWPTLSTSMPAVPNAIVPGDSAIPSITPSRDDPPMSILPASSITILPIERSASVSE